jgi:beta-lactam-binding protein with PASTA domain
MRRCRLAAVLIAVGLILVAAAAGCVRGREVPNVVGMPYDQAVQTLQDDGFKLGDTLDGYSNNATAGLVARQAPTAGSTLERNGAVTLTVVRPLGSVATPNLVGLTRAQAESSLTTFSLKPSVTEDYSSQVPVGVVFLQAPAAGAPINPGDTVEMVVSKGAAPAKVQVPKINGKKQSDAEAALKAVGLVPAPSQAYSDTVAKDIVADQNPVAGASMSPGSKVTFVVSLGQGAQSIAIPNVVGKSQADAEAAIKGAGLVPNAVLNVNPTVPKGIVAGQSPTAGAKTAPGAVVGILVSLGPDTSVTVPNVVGKTSAEADSAIKAAGLVPQAAVQPDAEVPKGIVISQGPAGGAKAEAGSVVLYTVSSGVPQ